MLNRGKVNWNLNEIKIKSFETNKKPTNIKFAKKGILSLSKRAFFVRKADRLVLQNKNAYPIYEK